MTSVRKSLSSLVALQYLVLADCRAITDLGVQSLSSLVVLQYLNLGATAITDIGVQVLTTELPNLQLCR